MKFAHVAMFPKGSNISHLLIYLADIGVEHRVSDSEFGCSLQVDISHTESVIGFLQNSASGQAADVTIARPSPPLLRALRIWPATFIVIILCIAGFLLAELDPQMSIVGWLSYVNYSGNWVITPQSFYDSIVASHQWWRMLTPAFLHFSALHLGLNIFGLWVLGRKLEYFLGTGSFLLLLLCIILVSNGMQYVSAGPALFGGLSGTVFGFVGAIAILSWRTQKPLLLLPGRVYVFAVIFALLGFSGVVRKVFGINIANTTLVAGFICGGVLAFVWPLSTSPVSARPVNSLPEETVPEDTLAEDRMPENTVPEQTLPVGTMFEDIMPEGSMFEDIMPENTAPLNSKSGKNHE